MMLKSFPTNCAVRPAMRGALLLLLLLLSACAGTTKKSGTVFYPPPPQTPRLQFLVSISEEGDLGKKESAFRKFLVGEERGEKQLARPYGIAHENGKIYIADKTLKQVVVLDLDASSFDYIRDQSGGALEDPTGIFIDRDGNKYVADTAREQIVVFGPDNQYLRSYGEEGQFRPTAVAVRGDRVYVCDILENEVEVLDKDSGEVLETIGTTGMAEGGLRRPTHITLDRDGNLFVTDLLNSRVQFFDPAGKFVRVIGFDGTGPGGMVRPKGIDIDRDNHLYVADAGYELVQIFDVESAEPLLYFGKFGPAPGATNMPAGVHIDYDNVRYFEKYAEPGFKLKYLVYIGNLLSDHKLNVYGFGEWTGGSLENYAVPESRPVPAKASTVPSLDDAAGALPTPEPDSGSDP